VGQVESVDSPAVPGQVAALVEDATDGRAMNETTTPSTPVLPLESRVAAALGT
jgi:hypothetical protein